MDNYIVSARKYRPSTFRSVVGQKSLTQTLKNAIEAGKLAHAYLFCGPRGVGKTTCARIFAKTINCLHPTPEGEACNDCESCVAFNEQRSYNISELDAASNNSVEGIRQLIEEVRIPPRIGQYKVYIIDEVHMLSTAAFNAFLKTLEEPPHHAIFILATTEKHKILPTILSRCQIYDFSRISIADTVEHLQYVASCEGVSAEAEALNIIAQKADGGMRDALSIFDQVVSFSGGNITYRSVIDNLNVLDYEYYFKLVDIFLRNAVPEALLVFNEILNQGFEGQHFLSGLAGHLRDLLVSKDASTLSLLEVAPSIAQRYGEQSALCKLNFLYKALEICNETDLNYRVSKNKRLLVELMLIRMCQLTQAPSAQSGDSIPLQPVQPVAPQSRPVQPAQPGRTSASQPEPAAPRTTPPATTASQSENAVPASRLAQLKDEISHDTGRPAPKSRPIPSFSIKKAAADLQPEKQTVQQEEKDMNTPFSETDLQNAWEGFIRSISTETVLANTMRTCRPVMKNATDFEVVVDNPDQLLRLNEKGAELMQYLKRTLKNTRIRLIPRVAEKQEKQKAFSQLEKFQLMAAKNPDLLHLKDKFGLELA